jgi:hypothetical protein
VKWFMVLFLIGTTACNKKVDPREFTSSNPTFDSYIAHYLSIKGRKVDYDAVINFKSLEPGKAGICIKYSTGQREIQIDPTYWNLPTTSLNEHISLIFHELGHCDLNRDHYNAFRQDGWPVSLMYWQNVGFPSNLEQYYYDELFGRKEVSLQGKIENLNSQTMDDDVKYIEVGGSK